MTAHESTFSCIIEVNKVTEVVRLIQDSEREAVAAVAADVYTQHSWKA